MAVKRTMPATKPDYAVKVTPITGEEVAADTFVVKQFGKRWLLAVIDGLGHGEDAVRASLLAKETIESSEEPHLATILTDCHAALKNTRGVVVGLALIEQRHLTWVGVGNIEGKVIWHGDQEQLEQSTLLCSPGVVGFNMPKINQQVYDMEPDTLIIIFTDGLNDKWVFPEGSWMFEMETEQLAERLMKSYQKGTDDSLVLVVRC